MKELVTANGQTFACESVFTQPGVILFTLEGQEADYLEAFFREVTELTVSFEGEEKPHGYYTEPEFSLAYQSVEKHADGTVTVRMKIKTEQEKRLDRMEERLAALETGEEIQNVAIQELGSLTGGGK